MSNCRATAVSCSNIAFIKYWGNNDSTLNLPANGSISMNLACLQTTTQVRFIDDQETDRLWINQEPTDGLALERVQCFLDTVRSLAESTLRADVHSENNFPTSAGLASSASAFAALALAAASALGLQLSLPQLSALARLGSGSAARSIPGGFVEWYPAELHELSYAQTIAPPDHWDLCDVIAIVQAQPKTTASTKGHALADSSPLQAVRVQNAPERLEICRQAILSRDFMHLAEVVELDSNLMHAAMMTSSPALFYWEPATLQIIKAVPGWRREGLQVCYTIDAGANVHLICTKESAATVERLVNAFSEVQDILISPPGGPARLV